MDSPNVRHDQKEMDYHLEWEFRSVALRWEEKHSIKCPIGVNFFPFATQYFKSMSDNGDYPIYTEKEKHHSDSFTNPYTYNCSIFATILTSVMDDIDSFVSSSEPMNELLAEKRRIRLYNELVIYITRFCEALIKQLLYCTDLPDVYYFRRSLGELLSYKCIQYDPKHKISMLGSIAHRYQLCVQAETCLMKLLRAVNRNRNRGAAHSEIEDIKLVSVSVSRKRLSDDSFKIISEFHHMLEHLSELETCMTNELGKQILQFFLDLSQPHS